MAWKSVTLRKRFFGNIFSAIEKGAKPFHGHGMEYFIDIVGLLCSIAYVVGSYCFKSTINEVYAFGDWCFIVASLINVGIAAHTLLEQLHAHEAEFPLKDETRDEYSESLLFLFSSLLFAVGCIFFMPGLTNTAANDLVVNSIGTWCFISGSFMLVLAVMYNAMGFHADTCEHGIDPNVAHLCMRLTRYGMFVLLFAGMFFTIGSFMYRPVFGGTCPARSVESACMAVKAYGTSLYIAGSYCLVIQGILTLTVGILKHRAEDFAEANESSKLLCTVHTHQHDQHEHRAASGQMVPDGSGQMVP